MGHDFGRSGTHVPRFAQDGRTRCTGVGTLMDYGANNGGTKNLEKWSKCSKEDLTKFYNSNGGSASFCLNTRTGTGAVQMSDVCAPLFQFLP